MARTDHDGPAERARGAVHPGDIGFCGYLVPRGAPKLRSRVLHHGSPRRGLGVARIDQPHAVAAEDLEHRVEHVAHHLLEVIGPLHGAVDPVHAFEEP